MKKGRNTHEYQKFDTNSNVKISVGDSGASDAFGRLRVSQITSLADIKQVYDKQSLFIDEVLNGTATSTHNADEASVTMATAADGDYVIRQTFQRSTYQAGKSQQIAITTYGFEPQTNITKRMGYFSSSTTAPYTADFDGLFMESSNGEIYLKVWRKGVEVSSTPSSQWNIDKLDGQGLSGLNVDWSLNQILFIDFQWLGVGRVRWALDIDGVIIPFHEDVFANEDGVQKVYMASPNQPLRWEIRQTGAGSGSFTHICASVGTEGTINTLGVERSVSTATTPLSASTSGTRYALLGYRISPDNVGNIIDILDFNLLATTNDNFHWELIFNPTVAGTFTYLPEPNSPVETAIGATANTVSGGILIDSGYGNQSIAIAKRFESALKLGHAIDGTQDEIVLCVTPLNQNLSIHGSVTWRELR